MDLTLVDLPGLTKAGDQTGIFGIWKLWESVKLDNMFCWTLSSSYRWHGGTTWNYMKPFQKWNLFNLFSVWRDIITTTESPISIPSSFTCQVPTADQPKDMPQKIRRPGRHRGLFFLGRIASQLRWNCAKWHLQSLILHSSLLDRQLPATAIAAYFSYAFFFRYAFMPWWPFLFIVAPPLFWFLQPQDCMPYL